MARYQSFESRESWADVEQAKFLIENYISEFSGLSRQDRDDRLSQFSDFVSSLSVRDRKALIQEINDAFASSYDSKEKNAILELKSALRSSRESKENLRGIPFTILDGEIRSKKPSFHGLKSIKMKDDWNHITEVPTIEKSGDGEYRISLQQDNYIDEVLIKKIGERVIVVHEGEVREYRIPVTSEFSRPGIPPRFPGNEGSILDYSDSNLHLRILFK